MTSSYYPASFSLQPKKAPFNIFCRAAPVVKNFLSFSLSGNVFPSSTLKDSFIQNFYFTVSVSTLGTSTNYFLVSKLPEEEISRKLYEYLVYVLSHFSCCFHILSFDRLYACIWVSLGLSSLAFIKSVEFVDSHIKFITFQKVLAIILSNYFLSFFSSPFGTPIMLSLIL